MQLKDYIESNEINATRWFKDLFGYRGTNNNTRYKSLFRKGKRDYIKAITRGNVCERDMLEVCYRGALENKQRAKHELALARQIKNAHPPEASSDIDAALLGVSEPKEDPSLLSSDHQDYKDGTQANG